MTLFQKTNKNHICHLNSYLKNDTTEILNPLNKPTFKYNSHPNIFAIKNLFSLTTFFRFSQVFLSDIKEELSHLNAKDASTFKNILGKVLTVSWCNCSETLKALFKTTVLTENKLNLADVTPVL